MRDLTGDWTAHLKSRASFLKIRMRKKNSKATELLKEIAKLDRWLERDQQELIEIDFELASR